LTQHTEAEGGKCRVQKASEFRPFTDQLTGGIVDNVGYHEDLTQKYVVPEDAALKFRLGKNPLQILKEKAEEDMMKREEAKKTYFDRHPPQW
jgi:hypothetical protein